ncbi:hypothetical protein ACFL6G_10170, partial [candidate division KSB1 bacterium]
MNRINKFVVSSVIILTFLVLFISPESSFAQKGTDILPDLNKKYQLEEWQKNPEELLQKSTQFNQGRE